MTLVSDLINHTVNDWLEPNRRHAMTKLTNTIATTDVVITVTYPSAITRGTVLSIDDEDIMVWAYDSVNQQTTDVLRGFRASAPAAHQAGTVVEQNTRFPRSRVLSALKAEIDGWGIDLYRVVPVSLVGQANMSWVDLTTSPSIIGCYGLVDVRIRRNNVGVPLQVSQYDRWPRLTHCQIARNMATVNFPSGYGLKLGEILAGPADVRVTAAMPFNTLSFAETTDITLIGLQESYVDLACLGASCRLLWGMEADRSDRTSAGEARRAQEVNVGATYQQGSMLERTYLRRLDLEKQKLMGQYPIQVR